MAATKEERERQKLERLGMSKENNQGYKMTIVKYNAANDMIVRFDDEQKSTAKCRWSQFESGSVQNPYEFKRRLGLSKKNNQGYMMTVIEYNAYNNMLVKFDDEEGTVVKCEWREFDEGCVENPYEFKKRLGRINVNNQGSLMKIVKYESATNVDVEFQDKFNYKARGVTWQCFENGEIKNPYYPEVYDIGVTGAKYSIWENGKHIKEYNIWRSMLMRCYDKRFKEKQPTYTDTTCCDEWLLFENFYEWLHSQSNFNRWLMGNGDWGLDKDIIFKNNKIYCSEYCCLVPQNVNNLFTNRINHRGKYPIGVCLDKRSGEYVARCCNPFTKKYVTIGRYSTPEKAFLAYKKYKENIIKQVAETEFKKGNITKRCYDAMLNYIIEITD